MRLFQINPYKHSTVRQVLKVPRGYLETRNRRNIDNTMAKKIKGQKDQCHRNIYTEN